MSGFATEIALEFAKACMAATPALYRLWLDSSQDKDVFLKMLDSALSVARARNDETLKHKHSND
jgi:hypothetical protein